MANYVYIARSLDGYIATSDGGVEWLDDIPNPQQSDYGFSKFISGIDALVMGRKTFEKVLSFGSWLYKKPVFVLSNSLKNVPAAVTGKAEIVNGDLHELINSLNKRGFHHLYIDGGLAIQSFLKEDLIDEMIITQIPILLGDGIPLFGKLSSSLKFKHTRTDIHNRSLVMSRYTRER